MAAVLITLLCLALAALLLQRSISRLAAAGALAATLDPARVVDATRQLDGAGAAVREAIDQHREARNRVVAGDR